MRIRSVIVALLMVGGSLVAAPPAQANHVDCTGGTAYKTMAQRLLYKGAAFFGNGGIAADLSVYETYVHPGFPAAAPDYIFSNFYLEINDGVYLGNSIRFGIVRHRVSVYQLLPNTTYGDPTIRVEWGYPRDGAGTYPENGGSGNFDYHDIRSYPGDLGSGMLHRLKFFYDSGVSRWRFYIDGVLVWTTPSGHPMNSFRSGQAVAIHAATSTCSSAYNFWADTWRYSTANAAAGITPWIEVPKYDVAWAYERDENLKWRWDLPNPSPDGVVTECADNPCQVYSS